MCKTVVRLRKQTLSLSIFFQIIFSSFPAFLLILILTTLHRTRWNSKCSQRLKDPAVRHHLQIHKEKDEKKIYLILIFFIINKLSKVEEVLSYFYRRASMAPQSSNSMGTLGKRIVLWVRIPFWHSSHLEFKMEIKAAFLTELELVAFFMWQALLVESSAVFTLLCQKEYFQHIEEVIFLALDSS